MESSSHDPEEFPFRNLAIRQWSVCVSRHTQVAQRSQSAFVVWSILSSLEEGGR